MMMRDQYWFVDQSDAIEVTRSSLQDMVAMSKGFLMPNGNPNYETLYHSLIQQFVQYAHSLLAMSMMYERQAQQSDTDEDRVDALAKHSAFRVACNQAEQILREFGVSIESDREEVATALIEQALSAPEPEDS